MDNNVLLRKVGKNKKLNVSQIETEDVLIIAVSPDEAESFRKGIKNALAILQDRL